MRCGCQYKHAQASVCAIDTLCPCYCTQTLSAVGLHTVLGLAQNTKTVRVPCLLMVLLVLSCQQNP